MSETERPPGEQPRQPGGPPTTPAGGRRGRALIVALVLGAAAFVIAFMLLVSQCGTDEDGSIYGQAISAVPVVELHGPGVPAG